MLFRYIRDYVNGSSANTGNHWVEIQALDTDGDNKALNQSITGSSPADASHPYTIAVDGNTDTAQYAYAQGTGLQFVEIDMGALYNIKTLKVWHYYADGRTYHNTKVEVSEDGDNWTVVFDSAADGEYPETSEGNIINLQAGELFADIHDVDSALASGFNDKHSVDSALTLLFDDRHEVEDDPVVFNDMHEIASASQILFIDKHRIEEEHIVRGVLFADRHKVMGKPSLIRFSDIHSLEYEGGGVVIKRVLL